MVQTVQRRAGVRAEALTRHQSNAERSGAEQQPRAPRGHEGPPEANCQLAAEGTWGLRAKEQPLSKGSYQNLQFTPESKLGVSIHNCCLN